MCLTSSGYLDMIEKNSCRMGREFQVNPYKQLQSCWDWSARNILHRHPLKGDCVADYLLGCNWHRWSAGWIINLNCNFISTLSRDFNVRKQNVHLSLSVLDQIEPSAGAREEQTTIIGPILNGECRADDTRKILREERDTLQSSNEHRMA